MSVECSSAGWVAPYLLVECPQTPMYVRPRAEIQIRICPVSRRLSILENKQFNLRAKLVSIAESIYHSATCKISNLFQIRFSRAISAFAKSTSRPPPPSISACVLVISPRLYKSNNYLASASSLSLIMSPRGSSSANPRSASTPYSRRPTGQPKSSRQQFSACGACRMRRYATSAIN